LRPALAEVVAAWPLGASLAAAVVVQGLRDGRRRATLNEALHELRRPLQALTLVQPEAAATEPMALQGSVQMAAVALERLEREINGETMVTAREPLSPRPLLASAVRRWQGRAALAGGEISLLWSAPGARVEVDRCAVMGALDNLLVNAIEHGGPQIRVEARVERERLRVAVVDSGRRPRSRSGRGSPAELIFALSGRRRRGHGLRVVRRTAAAHDGRFHLRPLSSGTEAVLELPLCSTGRGGGG